MPQLGVWELLIVLVIILLIFGASRLTDLGKGFGGMISAFKSEVKEGRLISVSLSGDFFFYPAEKLAELEASLEGTPLAEVENAIERFYHAQAIESPGVQPADFARVLVE